MHKLAQVGSDMTPAPEFLNSQQVAEITGLSRDYLDRMRWQHNPDPPPWFRVGRRCLYPRDKLQNWTEARLVAASGGAR